MFVAVNSHMRDKDQTNCPFTNIDSKTSCSHACRRADPSVCSDGLSTMKKAAYVQVLRKVIQIFVFDRQWSLAKTIYIHK